jgi:hypothetical protein
MMNLKRVGRYCIRGTIQEFAWRDLEKSRNNLVIAGVPA